MAGGWILTTPASRGIGFSLTRLLLQKTSLPIVATARRDLEGTKARLLDGLNDDVDRSRLMVLEVDVTRGSGVGRELGEESIKAAAAQCKERFGGKQNDCNSSYLRLAFAIPGILLHPEKSPLAINYEDALETFKINTLGPALLFKHFSQFLPTKRSPPFSPSSSSSSSSLSPSSAKNENENENENAKTLLLLPRMAVFAIMSARVGSISENSLGGWYSYRASKSGVNQLVKGFDIFLMNQKSGDGAIVVGLHPGTVKTGLSEPFWASTAKGKLFSPDYAAERLVGVVAGLKVDGRGKCWDWKGVEILP